jgi:cyclic pyranopterin phosphate synthase
MDCLSLSEQPVSRRGSRLTDTFGREITYLRLSLTDRCNLRCVYCMGSDVKFLPKADVLSLEEMERLCAAFIRLGVRKVRLTGGEPLLRPGVMGLIDRLGARVAAGELDELTLTTNGTLLAKHAAGLAAAGVRRINVSLDTLDAATFRRVTQRGELADVLAGIEAARAAGLAVRINVVALAGVNDSEYDRLIGWCGDRGCDLAMIELMPFGGQPHGQYQALDPVRELLAERWTLTPADNGSGGPCRYWHIAETGRRIGFITPMSHGFCADCNRVRVTCTGRLVPCMARHGDIDLRAALRGSEADDDLEAAIFAAVNAKPEGHQFNVGGAPGGGQRMWQLGG